MSLSHTAADPGSGPVATFSWTAHPARERRSAAWAGGLLIIALAVGAAVAGGHPAWAALAIVVLMIALNRFYFPSRFEMDGQGITARYPLRRCRFEWTQLRRYVADRNGGYLSTRATRSRLDAYRGMHLLFGRDRRDVEERIVACVSGGGAAP